MIDLGNTSNSSASSLVIQPSLAKAASGSSATRDPVEHELPGGDRLAIFDLMCAVAELAKLRISSNRPSQLAVP